jgi:hypothetical protein
MKMSNRIGFLGATLLVCIGSARGALAQSDETENKLPAAGTDVPSVGGDIGGGPNLLDVEYVTARVAFKPGDTLGTVTFAPWMKPPYKWNYSETRFGFSVEQDGTMGIGAGVSMVPGSTSPRGKLARRIQSTTGQGRAPRKPGRNLLPLRYDRGRRWTSRAGSSRIAGLTPRNAAG